MYPDSGYKLVHARSVCTRPFSLHREGPGDKARQQPYSYVHSYSQIALAVAHAITDCTHTRKSTDYCPNCTRKCVINYTNCYILGENKVPLGADDLYDIITIDIQEAGL